MEFNRDVLLICFSLWKDIWDYNSKSVASCITRRLGTLEFTASSTRRQAHYTAHGGINLSLDLIIHGDAKHRWELTVLHYHKKMVIAP